MTESVSPSPGRSKRSPQQNKAPLFRPILLVMYLLMTAIIIGVLVLLVLLAIPGFYFFS